MNHEDLFEMLGGGGGFPGGGFSGGGFPGGGGGLFGSMFSRGGPRRPRKGESTVQPLSVSLEDLYKGKTTKLQLTKKVICPTCDGVGGKQGAVKPCDKCRGGGRMFVTRQIGPGMIQQMATQCDGCSGQGEIINEKDKCKKCSGMKTIQEQKIIEVKITPGMRDNQKIVFQGEGDQEPDIEPGDVVLVVRTKSHDTFERKGDDLFLRKKISVNEALCGYTSVIQHLDGRNLVMSSVPGEVITPDSLRGILGEGMPVPNSPGHRGNLYVLFEIQFPENHFIPEDKYKKLESLLPPKPQSVKLPSNHEDVEEVTMSEYESRRYEGRGQGGQREAYHGDEDSDSDDMAGPHGQHVQCAQQ
ncbi:dnaJ central domain-containing protein [Ditylenchus destructor]|nr:dnaJ central domain-containing protein [Ditylenchus destructor]